MIHVLRIFGFAVASIESFEPVYEEEEQAPISGGSSHNFERDLNPVSPDDRYAPWDDFGFLTRGLE